MVELIADTLNEFDMTELYSPGFIKTNRCNNDFRIRITSEQPGRFWVNLTSTRIPE